MKAPEREVLPPLSYFPPDESYRVPAAAAAWPPRRAARRHDADVDGQAAPQAAGRLARIQSEGTAALARRLHRGAATEMADSHRLFVPFRDLTNGTETYPAGRYLDLDPTPTGLYDLDFNKAYNPYCAYNQRYDCPYPPAANRLKMPIRAGEKHARLGNARLQAVVFDFDGVIADSEPLHLRALQEALGARGIDLGDVSITTTLLGFNDDDGVFRARVATLARRRGATSINADKAVDSRRCRPPTTCCSRAPRPCVARSAPRFRSRSPRARAG